MFFIKYFDINHSSQKVRWKNSTKKVFVFLCSVFSLLFFFGEKKQTQLPHETGFLPTVKVVFFQTRAPRPDIAPTGLWKYCCRSSWANLIQQVFGPGSLGSEAQPTKIAKRNGEFSGLGWVYDGLWIDSFLKKSPLGFKYCFSACSIWLCIDQSLVTLRRVAA